MECRWPRSHPCRLRTALLLLPLIGGYTHAAPVGRRASVSALVAAPTVSVSPTAGFRDTSVLVVGRDFQPSDWVFLHWDAQGGPALGPATGLLTDDSGHVHATITIPVQAEPGGHEIIAVAQGRIRDSTTFLVLPDPTATATPPPTATPINWTCIDGLCPTPTVPGQSGSPPPPPSSTDPPPCGVMHPGTWGLCIVAALLETMAESVDSADAALESTTLMSETNPLLTTQNPDVQRYAEAIRLLANAFLLGLVLLVAADILFCIQTANTYAHLLERFWRLLLVAALVNLSYPLLTAVIGLADDATGGIASLNGADLALVRQQVGHFGGTLLLDGLAVVNGVLEFLIALFMIIRLGLLNGLLISAPAGLLCYGWVRSESWGQLWTRLFVATLVQQFFMVALLHLGEALWLRAPLVVRMNGTPTGATYSLEDGRLWARYLVALGTFIVVFLIPRLLRGQTGSPTGMLLLTLRSLARGGRL